MTGMYKSLKGHQSLCDVLKKQILNRNPRKEGIAFERKLNADGTYWKPKQYRKTSWVAATGPPFDSSDSSNLTGFSCELSYSSDESFDSNYKLFKNQSGEVFARYVGTNCRNGPPLRKIWVPKSCLENLQVNVLMTPPLENLNPRSNSSGGPKSSRGSKSSTDQNYARTRAYASNMQGNYKEYEYEHYSSNHYVHKSSNQFSAYSYEYFNPPIVKRSALASMPPFSYGARRMMNALPPQNYARTRAYASNMQGNYKEYEYEHYSSNHYVHKSSNQFSAYSYEYFNPPIVKRSALASMPPFSYGARRMMNALPPLHMWVVKKSN